MRGKKANMARNKHATVNETDNLISEGAWGHKVWTASVTRYCSVQSRI